MRATACLTRAPIQPMRCLPTFRHTATPLSLATAARHADTMLDLIRITVRIVVLGVCLWLVLGHVASELRPS
jgi:hypothetical protein